MSNPHKTYVAVYEIRPHMEEMGGYLAHCERAAREQIGRKLIEELALNGRVYAVRIDRHEEEGWGGAWEGMKEPTVPIKRVGFTLDIKEAERMNVRVTMINYQEMQFGDLSASAFGEIVRRAKRAVKFW